jgi:hypothetical protein
VACTSDELLQLAGCVRGDMHGLVQGAVVMVVYVWVCS